MDRLPEQRRSGARPRRAQSLPGRSCIPGAGGFTSPPPRHRKSHNVTFSPSTKVSSPEADLSTYALQHNMAVNGLLTPRTVYATRTNEAIYSDHVTPVRGPPARRSPSFHECPGRWTQQEQLRYVTLREEVDLREMDLRNAALRNALEREAVARRQAFKLHDFVRKVGIIRRSKYLLPFRRLMDSFRQLTITVFNRIMPQPLAISLN